MAIEVGTSGPQIDVARGGELRAPHSAGEHHRVTFPGRHCMGVAPRQRPQQKGPHPLRHVRKNENGKVIHKSGKKNLAKINFPSQVQRVARVHHFALREKLNHREFKYSERTLLVVNFESLDACKCSALARLDNT